MCSPAEARCSRQELQQYLTSKFRGWRPAPPAALLRRRGDVTLAWGHQLFHFLGDQLIYRLEKNDKIPKWVLVYSGGKTTKRIDDLAPRYPHRFRVKVILKSTAVPRLAELAVQHYGDEHTAIQEIELLAKQIEHKENQSNKLKTSVDTTASSKGSFDVKSDTDSNSEARVEEQLPKMESIRQVVEAVKLADSRKRMDSGRGRNGGGDGDGEMCGWLESQWSGETWTSTACDGSSPPCFAMAVKCGYLKQVQAMAEERPELVELVNSSSGHTPLATAVRRGDISCVRLLLALGAQVEQPSLAGQTPLQLAVLAGDAALLHLLLERGASLQSRDCNGLRAEHYAVDSGCVDMVRCVLDRGGDVAVTDNNGWTPLFRAICQGASSAVVRELVSRGSDVSAVDAAGLPLRAAAELLRDRHGRPRHSIIRLVDAAAAAAASPREKALAHFTRVSRKIHHAHTLLRIN